MEWTMKDMIQIVIGSGGLIGICILVFHMGKFSHKVETIEIRNEAMINSIGSRFDEVNKKADERYLDILKTIEKTTSMVNGRLGYLEEKMDKIEDRLARVEESMKWMERFMTWKTGSER